MPRIPSSACVLGPRLASSKASALRPWPARPARPCAHASEEVST